MPLFNPLALFETYFEKPASFYFLIPPYHELVLRKDDVCFGAFTH